MGGQNRNLMKMFSPSDALLTQEGKEGLEGSVFTFWAAALDLNSGHELVR